MCTKCRYYAVYAGMIITAVAFVIASFTREDPILGLNWDPIMAVFWTLACVFCTVNTRKSKTYPTLYFTAAGGRFLATYTGTGQWQYALISLAMLTLCVGTDQLLPEDKPKNK